MPPGSVTLHPYPGECPRTPRSGLTVNEDAQGLAKESKVSLKPFQRLAESRDSVSGRTPQSAKPPSLPVSERQPVTPARNSLYKPAHPKGSREASTQSHRPEPDHLPVPKFALAERWQDRRRTVKESGPFHPSPGDQRDAGPGSGGVPPDPPSGACT